MCKEFVVTLRNLDESKLKNVSCADFIRDDISKIDIKSFQKMKALSIEQVWMIYNFLETPSERLIDSLSDKSDDDVKKYYRNVAKQLHPDKNCHPRSNEAFQKIKNVIESVNKQRRAGG